MEGTHMYLQGPQLHVLNGTSATGLVARDDQPRKGRENDSLVMEVV